MVKFDDKTKTKLEQAPNKAAWEKIANKALRDMRLVPTEKLVGQDDPDYVAAYSSIRVK